MFSRRAKLGIVRYTRPDIRTLAKLLESGEYRPAIDRTYRLEDVVETHQKTGNVVLTVS
jgi:NADPH:quinone reductase-like Zn-dependent oxidoreductase